jgi:hypothetical protein
MRSSRCASCSTSATGWRLLLVGLTATPKDEVDRNTYSLFELENGVPTDAYSLEEAVRDGFLVPFRAVSVPLRFQREGISYDDLSPDEKDQWDALEWDEEGNIPDRVEPEALNRWLFNKDTVDKVLAHLMTAPAPRSCRRSPTGRARTPCPPTASGSRAAPSSACSFPRRWRRRARRSPAEWCPSGR